MDQLIEVYGIPISCKRWYFRIFFWVIDVVAYNMWCICRGHWPGGLAFYQQFRGRDGHRQFIIALGTALATYQHTSETEVFYEPQRRRSTLTAVPQVTVHRPAEFTDSVAMDTAPVGLCDAEPVAFSQGQCESCLRIKKKRNANHVVNRPRMVSRLCCTHLQGVFSYLEPPVPVAFPR